MNGNITAASLILCIAFCSPLPAPKSYTRIKSDLESLLFSPINTQKMIDTLSTKIAADLHGIVTTLEEGLVTAEDARQDIAKALSSPVTHIRLLTIIEELKTALACSTCDAAPKPEMVTLLNLQTIASSRDEIPEPHGPRRDHHIAHKRAMTTGPLAPLAHRGIPHVRGCAELPAICTEKFPTAASLSDPALRFDLRRHQLRPTSGHALSLIETLEAVDTIARNELDRTRCIHASTAITAFQTRNREALKQMLAQPAIDADIRTHALTFFRNLDDTK